MTTEKSTATKSPTPVYEQIAERFVRQTEDGPLGRLRIDWKPLVMLMQYIDGKSGGRDVAKSVSDIANAASSARRVPTKDNSQRLMESIRRHYEVIDRVLAYYDRHPNPPEMVLELLSKHHHAISNFA